MGEEIPREQLRQTWEADAAGERMVLPAEKAMRKHVEFQQRDASRILPLRIYVRVKDVCLDSISSLEEG